MDEFLFKKISILKKKQTNFYIGVALDIQAWLFERSLA